MNSETLGWSQGQPVPSSIPAVTLFGNAITLDNVDTGPIELPLPKGSAYTMLSPRGGVLCRNERRFFDRFPGLHAAMVIADNDASGPNEFDPALLAWIYRRSDLLVIWGAGASPATVGAVFAWMRGMKRVGLLFTDEKRQDEWHASADRAAQHRTYSPYAGFGRRSSRNGAVSSNNPAQGALVMSALPTAVSSGAVSLCFSRRSGERVLGTNASHHSRFAVWSSDGKISAWNMLDVRVDGEPCARRVAALMAKRGPARLSGSTKQKQSCTAPARSTTKRRSRS